MKKRIFFTIVGCLTVLSLISCHPDKSRGTYYTYINQTASTVTIECYYGRVPENEVVNPDDLYKTLTIPAGEKNTVVFDGRAFAEPFGWQNRAGVYLLVKNEKVKVFDAEGDDSLRAMETYTLTSASDTVRHYEYVFTDDYFKDGEPIE